MPENLHFWLKLKNPLSMNLSCQNTYNKPSRSMLLSLVESKLYMQKLNFVKKVYFCILGLKWQKIHIFGWNWRTPLSMNLSCQNTSNKPSILLLSSLYPKLYLLSMSISLQFLSVTWYQIREKWRIIELAIASFIRIASNPFRWKISYNYIRRPMKFQ